MHQCDFVITSYNQSEQGEDIRCRNIGKYKLSVIVDRTIKWWLNVFKIYILINSSAVDSFISRFGLPEMLITMAGEQYKWLERDLASVDRSITPWLIATWHPPWYSSYEVHYKEAECMRVEMENLLYSYGVDIVFNGHVSHPLS